MYLLSTNAGIDVSFAKSAGEVKLTLEPGIPYVLSAAQYTWLSKAPCAAAIDRVSHLEARFRNFLADPRGGRGTLVFYAGAGGYGDQLLALPVIKLLADLGYEVTVLVDPGNQACFSSHAFIKAIHPLPIPYATFKLFSHHVLLQEITNLDEHGEQQHPVDAMLHRIGIDPRTIPPDRKRLAPVITPHEREQADRFVGGRPIALYQLGGSGENRRLTPGASRTLFMSLAELVPELLWVGLYDHHIPGDYYAPLPADAPKNAQLFTFPGLRQLFAVAERCVVGVSIDSLLVHLLGSSGKPCIGLWGPLPPELRTHYYPRHLAIWHRGACPGSPCLRYKPTLEKCPPEARAAGQCLCLKDVAAEEVAAAVRSLITR